MKTHFIDESLLGIVEHKAANLGTGTTARDRRNRFNDMKRIFSLLYAPKGTRADSVIYMGYGCNSKGESGLIVVTNEGDSVRSEQQGGNAGTLKAGEA